MRAIVWLFSAWMAVSPAFADSAFVAPTATGTAATGQIPGTTTSDDAAAGKVGEYASVNANVGFSTVTFTNASPTVVTWTAHPYPINSSGIVSASAIHFTNSGGALPTGITTSTYYFVPIDANTGRIGTTVANALAGTFANASSTGTGTQTGFASIILASGTAVDLGGIALTAGDWEVDTNISFSPGASTVSTGILAGISTTSATLDTTTGGRLASLTFPPGTVVGNLFDLNQTIPPVRITLSSTTNIFFLMKTFFSISTMTGYGLGKARRAR